MVRTKDLRDMFEEATKRASEALNDAKVPSVTIGRRAQPVGVLWFGLGIALGAIVGIAIGILATPMTGIEARQRLGERVDKMRKTREEIDGEPTYASPTATGVTTNPYER